MQTAPFLQGVEHQIVRLAAVRDVLLVTAHEAGLVAVFFGAVLSGDNI